MHFGLDYGVQVFCDNILETPSAYGFMNTNGQFNNTSKKKIYVYSNEGRIPHCHYVDQSTGREICVRLDKPEYFSHGSKNNMFTVDEKKTFVMFMSWIPDGYKENTWMWCKRTWNGFAQEDNNMNIINTTTIPDYTKL